MRQISCFAYSTLRQRYRNVTNLSTGKASHSKNEEEMVAEISGLKCRLEIRLLGYAFTDMERTGPSFTWMVKKALEFQSCDTFRLGLFLGGSWSGNIGSLMSQSTTAVAPARGNVYLI